MADIAAFRFRLTPATFCRFLSDMSSSNTGSLTTPPFHPLFSCTLVHHYVHPHRANDTSSKALTDACAARNNPRTRKGRHQTEEQSPSSLPRLPTRPGAARTDIQVARLLQYLSRLFAWYFARRGHFITADRLTGLKEGLAAGRKGDTAVMRPGHS